MYAYATHWPPRREQRGSLLDADAAHLSMQACGAALSTHAMPEKPSAMVRRVLGSENFAANFLIPSLQHTHHPPHFNTPLARCSPDADGSGCGSVKRGPLVPAICCEVARTRTVWLCLVGATRLQGYHRHTSQCQALLQCRGLGTSLGPCLDWKCRRLLVLGQIRLDQQSTISSAEAPFCVFKVLSLNRPSWQ
jgi:hypothetical protein